MGFRFRRSVQLFPGLRLNLSKSGVSTSIGRRGATLNLGPRGPRYTVGLPGSGLSYSQRLAAAPRPRPVGGGRPSSSGLLVALVLGSAVLVVVILIARNAPAPAPARESLSRAVGAGEVTASALRCRADPSTAGPVVVTLKRGARVSILAQSEGWSRVSAKGADCWVADSFLSRTSG